MQRVMKSLQALTIDMVVLWDFILQSDQRIYHQSERFNSSINPLSLSSIDQNRIKS